MRNRTEFKDDCGLAYYDDNPSRTLSDKVAQAAARYRKKYGEAADLCYVHPSALSDAPAVTMAGEVRVKSLPTVLPHCFWVGVAVERRRGRIVQGRLL